MQYGLRSLKEGKITPAEFLHLNWNVGGWKHPSQMVQETFPFFGTTAAEINKALTIPGYFDPWSSKNMLPSAGAGQPMPRSKGDPIAMRAAYTSGHVFSGELDVPAIDHRQYMERELDMHNSHQSFAIAAACPADRWAHSDNMVVWFTDTTPGVPKASQSLEALAVMDQWLTQHAPLPAEGHRRNKPAGAVDACYDLQGKLIYRGSDAWNGILDDKAPRDLHADVPALRYVAHRGGRTDRGRHLQLRAQVGRQAVADGTYAPWMPECRRDRAVEADLPGGSLRLQPSRIRRGPDERGGGRRAGGRKAVPCLRGVAARCRRVVRYGGGGEGGIH